MVLAENAGGFGSSGLAGEIIFSASPFLRIVFHESLFARGNVWTMEINDAKLFETIIYKDDRTIAEKLEEFCVVINFGY